MVESGARSGDLDHLPEYRRCGFLLLQGDHMKKNRAPRREQSRKVKPNKLGRPAIGIRELKTKASAIIDDVKGRRVSYAVTKRGRVEALIVPSDAGERLLTHSNGDTVWNAWQILTDQLLNESGKKTRSAVAELEQMRR
jgi:antitoxin (DNA-binding transcriptional repressor) of toxin-antitoxin stability system